jgi:uncharacterized protein involved in type VI secretion and phage assembly
MFDGGMTHLAPGLARAIVRANEDPDKLGRIKVEYPAFHGESAKTPSEWARLCVPYASSGHGGWFLPEVGDEVLVVFENGNLDHPIVLGALYGAARKPPTSGRPGDGKSEVRFLKTKSGHLLCFDDGSEGKVTLQDKDGRKFEIDSSKQEMTIADTGGNVVKIEPAKISIQHKSGDKVELKGGEVVVHATGKISLGEGAAHPVVFGDALMQLFNTHTHVAPLGPTSPPIVPMTPSQYSAKVKTV